MSKMEMIETHPVEPWLASMMEHSGNPVTLKKYDPCHTVYKWGDDKAEVSARLYAVAIKPGTISHFVVKLYNVKEANGELEWEFDHSTSWLFSPRQFEKAESEFQEITIIVDCINSVQPWKGIHPDPEELAEARGVA
tara:strand:+ start:118 stop:528 length:411 start_codon:yes stop_codon:yes gene_type:complete